MQNNGLSPFAGLYTPLPDLKAYLDRIGFNGTPKPTLECLKELTKCQLFTVPFENLDVYHAGRIPSLETEALFDKIVINRRGGYCFELNGLFLKLLKAIGFTAFASAARIMLGCNHLPPPAHEIIWVEIGEKLYFCDVGYGGPSPLCPLEFVFDKVQTDGRDYTYKFAKNRLGAVLEVNIDGEFQTMMAVSQEPCEPVDFLPLNAFCATSRYAPFISRQMLCRHTPNGKCTVNNDLLRIKDGDKATEITLKTEDELREALIRYFGINYTEKLKIIG